MEQTKAKWGSFIRLIIFVILVMVLFQLLGSRMPTGISLLNNVSVKIEHPDKTVDEYDSNEFDSVMKGDKVFVTVFLPENEKIENGALRFYTCHCTIEAKYDGKTIYSAKQELEKKGDIIGGSYPTISIPDEAWGNSIVIELDVAENEAFYQMNSMELYPMRDAYLFTLNENLFGLFVSITGITMGIILLGMYLFNGPNHAKNRKGCCIAVFVILMSLWIFASNGFYTLILGSHIWIIAEYVSIFLVSSPLLVYFFDEPLRDRYGKLIRIKFSINILFVICAFALNQSNIFHFNRILIYAHALLFIDALIFLYLVMGKRVYLESRNMGFFRVGFWALLFFGLLDILRYNFAKFFQILGMEASQSVLPFGLTFFVICLFLAFVEEAHDIEKEQQEKIYFKQMAYIDQLTGISSRRKITELMRELEERGSENFGIVSFDLNNLKMTNDLHGHEVGDQLICTFTELARKSFSKDVCFGRMGGDEFLAIAEGSQVKTLETSMQDLHDRIVEFNAESGENVLFHVSFSYGISYSTSKKPISVQEAMREADHIMYEMKAKQRLESGASPDEEDSRMIERS